MSRYTDFKLFWETYGGYPDRAFQSPDLIWIVGSGASAARCKVERVRNHLGPRTFTAVWETIPYEPVEAFKVMLDEIGAFDQLKPLVTVRDSSPYMTVWDFEGLVGERAFHFSLEWFDALPPSTPLGQRFFEALYALRGGNPFFDR
jgi:hypothetical protein